MSQYDFTKTPCAPDSLTQEIQQSSITIALDHITLLGSALSIFFKADLSAGEQTTLSTLVTNHAGVPLPQNTPDPVTVTSMPDPAPFATPAYRTKRSKNSAWVTCPADTATTIDFQMASELYASGGLFIYKDAKEGDYLTAEVYDKDSVIPEGYRAALCEAWPSVAKYVIGAWILPITGYGSVEVNTYPLNAKISAGLYLRITYHACATAGDRKAAINYFLTKKL